MAIVENRAPTDKEIEILRRNGIDATAVAVKHSDKDTIRFKKLKTGDEIVIHRGYRKW